MTIVYLVKSSFGMTSGKGIAEALSHRGFFRRDRHLLHDFDPEALETGDLAGVGGEQANAFEVQVRQDLRADADLALGAPLALGQRCQLLLVVELDGHMVAESLHRIALGGRVQVDQRPAAFFRDAPHGGIDDVAASDRKSTRLNSSHANISYAVFCLKKKQ